MEPFAVSSQEGKAGIPVIAITGYFSKEGGEAVEAKINASLDGGRKKIVLDMSGCTVINSPGIAKLMEMAMKVIDDFQGALILVGLDNSKKQFLGMTGVLPLAGTAATLDEAFRTLGA